MKKLIFLIIGVIVAGMTAAYASDNDFRAPQDSVIIEYGKNGKLVIIVDNAEDFKRLKGLDINKIVSELGIKMDSTSGKLKVVQMSELKNLPEYEAKEIARAKVDDINGDYQFKLGRLNVKVRENPGEDAEVEIFREPKFSKPYKRRNHVFDLDLGFNNYLETGEFPAGSDDYSVKTWGSWYIGFNWKNYTYLSKNGAFQLVWGPSLHWYNWKLDNRDVSITKGPDQVLFTELQGISGTKSKISASYLNFSMIPKFDFGAVSNSNSSLRIGVGPYVGYRLGSRAKHKYRDEEGDRQRVKNRSNLYLSDLRYGIRTEIGWKGVDFFFNYDLNEVFRNNRGPELNAISIGISL